MTNNILAIESSCDETSVAIMVANRLVSHLVNNQKIHANYGGVVPEIASRNHQKNIVPILQKALKQASIKLQNLTHIAFTQGPGLIGSLLVGACFAKALAYSLKLPLVATHHIKAHVLANFIEKPHPSFPFLALVVSGGHTQLILVKNHLTMDLLGQTKDDAIGEAFDKIAKMLGLPYPGGIWIDRYAKQGNVKKFVFPTTTMPHLDFSFSGIKTAFYYLLQKKIAQNTNFIQENLHHLCASIQTALVDIVINKLQKAQAQTGIKQIALGGGVAANSYLRQRLQALCTQKSLQLFVPKPQFCTDNAAMIAINAYYQIKAHDLAHYHTPSLARMNI